MYQIMHVKKVFSCLIFCTVRSPKVGRQSETLEKEKKLLQIGLDSVKYSILVGDLIYICNSDLLFLFWKKKKRKLIGCIYKCFL